jgi:hypothetical protein
VLADSKGNLKRRPCIVLTPTNEIKPDREISVMAISTSYPEPTPTGLVELPWHNDKRRAPTQLTKRSAAVIHWLCFVRHEEVEELAGDVPPQIMLDILKRLEGQSPT